MRFIAIFSVLISLAGCSHEIEPITDSESLSVIQQCDEKYETAIGDLPEGGGFPVFVNEHLRTMKSLGCKLPALIKEFTKHSLKG
jgi:hypothetical protein